MSFKNGFSVNYLKNRMAPTQLASIGSCDQDILKLFGQENCALAELNQDIHLSLLDMESSGKVNTR